MPQFPLWFQAVPTGRYHYSDDGERALCARRLTVPPLTIGQSAAPYPANPCGSCYNRLRYRALANRQQRLSYFTTALTAAGAQPQP